MRELAGEDGTIGDLANDFINALLQGAEGEGEGEGGMGGHGEVGEVEDEVEEDEYDSEGFDES